jgi:uncharacterized cupredoxin-like copper-binding protein/Cu/Ag efflux protein CusF
MHQLTKTMLTNATNASGIVFTLGVIIATTSIAFAHGDKPHSNTEKKTISTDVHPWGQEGDAKKITRTINISMRDNMRFTPDTIDVKQGETIKFVVKNNGRVMHEMVIGTKDELAKHAETMKRFPNMEHDEAYMAHVAVGKQADMVWHFSKAGTFMFACLIPGHFEAGMQGTIRVSPLVPLVPLVPIASSIPATTKNVLTPPSDKTKGNTMNKEIKTVLAAAAIAVSPAGNLANAEVNKVETPKLEQSAAPAVKLEMADGEVKKIDKDQKKITLKHGVIKNLDMPAMTMVFQVKDVKLLDNVKVGDKVKFSAEQSKSAIIVTQLESAK